MRQESRGPRTPGHQTREAGGGNDKLTPSKAGAESHSWSELLENEENIPRFLSPAAAPRVCRRDGRLALPVMIQTSERFPASQESPGNLREKQDAVMQATFLMPTQHSCSDILTFLS